MTARTVPMRGGGCPCYPPAGDVRLYVRLCALEALVALYLILPRRRRRAAARLFLLSLLLPHTALYPVRLCCNMYLYL